MESLTDVSVQHHDMVGTIALDWHGGTDIYEFAQECAGVDTDRYVPLALSFRIAIDAAGEEPNLSLTFYAADKEEVGYTIDDICRYALDRGGSVPTRRFDGKATLRQFLRYAKRVETVLRPSPARFPSVVHIEYESGSHDGAA